MAWAVPSEAAKAETRENRVGTAQRDAQDRTSQDSATPDPNSNPSSPDPSASAASSASAPAQRAPVAAQEADARPKKKEATESAAPPLDQADSLPTGGDKTGVTSRAISLPQGSGKIQGMGESFSAQLSTGIATFSVPFSLLPARGGAQPSLGLSYSSSGGFGLAGVGWDVGVPFIARQTDRGVPSYDDRAAFHPNQDHFVFNGGQELVPICVVTGGVCAGAPGEVMPAWGEGSQYFRPRVEGSFLRFFWSADHKTWRVQDKSGVTMELGVPLDGSHDTSALDVNPSAPEQIYRWHLVRQYDTQGSGTTGASANPPSPNVSPTPSNVVVYQYVQNGGMAYLSDIYDTTPNTTPATTAVGLFAHHTHLNYEQRSDPTFSFRSGWRIDQTERLAGVDVTSKTFHDEGTGARHQVRRYHLSYDPAYHASLLASVQVEGRCSSDETKAPAEKAGAAEAGAPSGRVVELLDAVTGCDTLPAMTFAYTHVSGTSDLPSYEAINEQVHSIASSPTVSIDAAGTGLMDINADGLPDVLQAIGGPHSLFLNSAGGKADSFGALQNMTVQGISLGSGLFENESSIKLSNLSVAPLDLDGDGTINLLHLPLNLTYASYAPQFASGAWSWAGRKLATISQQNPKINFVDSTSHDRTKVMDVNGDGLVDIVVSTGTQYQTFFALGRLPGGDSQFGHGSWTSATEASLSNDPVTACVPWSAEPVMLDDPQIKISDMNGDGLADLVRVRTNEIRYWPGRGDGSWGTGASRSCKDGFDVDRSISMSNSPHYTDVNGTTLRMEDVNGDGLEDLIQVNMTAVEVWLNVDGRAWTAEHVIYDTPAAPSFQNRVLLTDINGSGTPDILWGNGGSSGQSNTYQYIDLQGGVRPWLLSGVSNGLGKSTQIEYSTSTAEMLAADSLQKCDPASDPQGYALNPWGCAWTMKMPTIAHVVKRVTESDNLGVAGQGPGTYVTEYQYRDPLFEGRQREFRGFTRARSKRIGDANSPSDFTESAFLLGECEDETPGNGIDECSLPERWRDNPREALKGLPIFTEKYSEAGVYLSTDSSSYRLRRLFVGLDGREVRQAFESSKKTVLYDSATGPQSGGTASSATTVGLETEKPATSWDPINNQLTNPGQLAVGESVTASRSSLIPQRSASGVAVISSASEVDFAGNKLVALDYGCHGGDACPVAMPGIVPDETIVHVTKPALVSGNASGWLWRTTESWVAGSVHTERRGHATVGYDVFGNPTTTTADLQGVVALDRFTTIPANGIAPLPATRSADGQITVSTNVYNSLGLLIQEQGAQQRCRDVSYASDAYQQFPTGETIHTSGGCASTGSATLTTTAMYDRGLGASIQVTDMQVQVTKVTYDAFGRLSALYRPVPNTDGATSTVPSVLVEYTLPSPSNPVKYSVIHTKTQDGASDSDASYLESYSYVDGMGRAIVSLSEADKGAEDLGAWIASGFQSYDAKGAVARKYLPFFYDSSATAFPVGSAPASSTPYGRQRYDAFGRQLQTFDLDGTVTLQSVYHALSSDLYDAADLNGPHQGSYASTRSDGHGRTIATTERTHVNGAIEAREVRMQYLATGAPEAITRVRVGKTDAPVIRWMRYDTLGHLVLNVDPNTTQNFSSDLTTSATPSPTGLKAWRYAYNDAGDLVGTSDARGCGENFTYDDAGRLLTEDYSPCGQPTPYSAPTAGNGSGPTGYEVLYFYDSAPDHPFSDTTLIARPPGYTVASSSYLKGRLTAVWSRGKTEWTNYDGRGRVTQTAVLPALPVDTTSHVAPNLLTQRYGTQWYYRTFSYDGADREVSATTGSTVAQLQGTALTPGGPTSAVTTTYSNRGTVKKVGSTYGDLVTRITRTADGLVSSIVYGDAAGTTTDSDYDARRRLRDVQTYRGPPSIWNTPPNNYTPAPALNGAPSSFQLVLQDQEISYDIVGNPTEIHDYRAPEEWPAGAKPLTKKIQYDDLYRATRIDYQAAGGATDSWTSPFAPEIAGLSDPRRSKPGTHVTFTSRPLYQTFNYDWLGNTQASDDDAHGFYDRSLGTITNDTAGGHPYQLQSASNKSGPASTRNGSFSAIYDAAGNLSRANLERNGPCLPAGAPCSSRFQYYWDEVGRLTRAFRVDAAFSTLPALTTDASTLAGTKTNLDYLYDESDERIVKTYTPSSGVTSSTLYPYETLEVRGTALVAGSNPPTTSLTADNEVPYLVAHGVGLARVVFEEPPKGEPRVSGSVAGLHVLFELGDQLGSTAIVVDKDSSELVEAETYQGYGAKESDYRPDRWKGYRDDYGFTGKEEDIEFGVVYFGKRFYSPGLNRWLSADPLGVHGPGKADLNLYAYVSGRVLQNVDPLGLESTAGERQYQYWSQAWADEKNIANQQMRGIEAKFNDNPHFGAKLQDFKDGNRDALGAEYRAAADRYDRASFYESQFANVHQWLVMRVDTFHLTVTQRQIDAAAQWLAKKDEIFQALLGAAVGISEGRASGPPRAAPEPAESCAGGKCAGGNVCFAAGVLVATESGLVPIETLDVGDRVLTSDGQSETEVDSTWRLIELEMPNPIAPGDTIAIRLLRPSGWVMDNGVELGRVIPLDFAEINLAGDTLVTRVSAAPVIAPGAGRVVLATITHKNNALYRLHLNGDSDIVEPTAPHLFYSVDRGDWIPTSQLELGEHLLSATGVVTVTGIERLAGAAQVFNLEVESQHEFLVSRLGVLTHNADACPDPALRNGWKPNPDRDLDWRGTSKGLREAVKEAFRRTGVPKDRFQVWQWGKDAHGKSFPVEWRAKGGAEVSIDVGHTRNGPGVPHVGYQTPGKGNIVGHILLDDVPVNRP
jgi:RHS repeat-associated protein